MTYDEPIIAYRGWLHDYHGTLYACTDREAWPVGGPMEARCRDDHALGGPRRRVSLGIGSIMLIAWALDAAFSLRLIHAFWQNLIALSVTLPLLAAAIYWIARGARNHGVAPLPNCFCGIYCHKTERNLARNHYGNIYGRVAIWGRIQVHRSGYRAQFAYPQVLYLFGDPRDAYVRRVAEKYGCEGIPMTTEMKLMLTSQGVYV